MNIPKLERIDSPSGRLYRTPEGNLYPSVTTILSTYGDKSYLDEWRAKVGNEVADKITKNSADRGTLLHSWCEDYLQGKEVKPTMFQMQEYEMFKYFLPVLDSIEEVICIEQSLWSDKLRCAGSVDLIAIRKGRIKVLDWKNSRRYKSKDEIPTYFMQTAAYAYMFWERTGILVQDLEVAISTEDYGLVLYNDNIKNWLPKFTTHRATFKL